MINISNEAKEKYKGGIMPKEMVVSFPNGEHADIHNDEIVAESLEFQENLVKGEFKFGLCQANYLKFETVADVSECTGAVIDVSIFIDGTEISLGRFTIESVSREDEIFTVSSYGAAIVENQEWSSTEIGKRQFWVFDNVPYTARMDLLFGSQVGFLNLEECVFKRNQPLAVIGRITTNARIPQRNNALCRLILEYKGGYLMGQYGDEFPAIDEVFKFNLVKSESYAEIMEIIDGVETAWTSTSPFNTSHVVKPINRGLMYVEGAYFDGSFVSSAYYHSQEIEFDFNEPFYPYLSGLKAWAGTARTYFNSYYFGMPTVLTIQNTETGITETLDLYVEPTLARYQNQNTSEIISINRDVTTTIYGGQKVYSLSENVATEKKPKIINDYYELRGYIGRATRNGAYEFFEFGDAEAGVYPSNLIYPGVDLFPQVQNAIIIRMDEYENLKLKVDREEPFGAVFYDYLDSTNQKAIGLYQFDERYPKAYYLKDNSVLTNAQRTPVQINAMLDELFIPKLRKVAWTKSTLDATALPWLESGDPIAIKTRDGAFATYIFNRTLKGIQSATDNIDSDVSASDVNAIATGAQKQA